MVYTTVSPESTTPLFQSTTKGNPMLNHFLDKLFGSMQILIMIELALGCGGKDDPPPNCGSTVNCPNVDGGSDVDADDDATAPDANTTTPDGNTADACAPYEWLNGTVWNCPNIYDNMTVTYHEDLQACVIRLEGLFSDDARDVFISADHQHLTDADLGVDCWNHNL